MSGFTLSSLKNSLDEVRAQYYPKNETEKKVYEALSSKNWGASSTLMNDIANETNDYEKYRIITNLIWTFLDNDGRTWKNIFKTLTLIEFLIKNGSERFIEECRDKMYRIRSLQDYNYYEGTIDKGSGVREKAKQIVELLGSNEMIRDEREKARALRNKFVGIDSRNAGGNYGYSGSDSYSSGGRYGGNSNNNDSYSNNAPPQRRASDSYSSGGSGRYGGGAYDSSRPTRYGDEPQENQSYNSRYDDEEPAKPARSKSIAATPTTTTNSTTTTGGKLKVSIKKVSDTSSVSAPKANDANLLDTADVDLMGGPVTASVAPAQASVVDFDPFATAPSTTSTSSNFDPFGSSQQAANNSSSFDPFGPSSGGFPVAQSTPAPVPAAFDPFGSSTTTNFPANNNFGYSAVVAPAPAVPVMQSQGSMFPNSMSPMNNYPYPAPSQGFAPAPAITNYQTQMPAKATSNDADFGDFEVAPQTASSKSTTAADKWGNLGKLVDLNRIEKNNELAAKQAATTNANSYNQNSFAGLDGFSKTPQNMAASTTAARPLGSYNNTGAGGTGMVRPMNAPMGSGYAPMGAPMGMGGAPMGGMGMGMGTAPMGGMGFGAPAAAPYNSYPGQPNGFGAPMNGGNFGNSGAYPNPGMAGGYPMGGMPMGGMPMGGMNNNPNNFGNQGFGMQPPRGPGW